MENRVEREIISFIEPNIEKFHKKRLENLLDLKLNDILKRKNPYLFKVLPRTLLNHCWMRTCHLRKREFSADSLKNWQFLYAVNFMEEENRPQKV